MENNLTWQEFERVSMHVGTIWKSKIFRRPKPAYQLTIDLEKLLELEKLRHKLPNSKADLIERQIVAVVNFPKNKLVSS
jgi:tRNA-binding protein